MAEVAWDLDSLVLHDVLLNNSHSSFGAQRLVLGLLIDIGLRNESIIARDVRSYFSGAYCQLVGLIFLLRTLPT